MDLRAEISEGVRRAHLDLVALVTRLSFSAWLYCSGTGSEKKNGTSGSWQSREEVPVLWRASAAATGAWRTEPRCP